MMAMYIAQKILQGDQKYEYVFGIRIYRRYQEDVDAILIGEGRQDLIIKDEQ